MNALSTPEFKTLTKVLFLNAAERLFFKHHQESNA
jgi:hypothetical protein